MERYKKLRNQIRHMSDAQFPQAEENADFAKMNQTSPQQYVAEDLSPKALGKKSPYLLYKKRLWKRTLVVAGFFVLALIGFAVWFVLLQGREA